jgi:hypothetical protein
VGRAETLPLRLSRGLLLAFYALELSLAVAALGLCKRGDRDLGAFLGTRAGAITAVAALVLLGSLAAVARAGLDSRRSRRGFFAFTLLVNVVPVTAALGIAEAAVSALSMPGADAPSFFGTLLLPRDWQHFAARQRLLLERAAAQGAYLAYHPELGWRVGENRESRDGLYFSSAEGLRSPRTPYAFARTKPLRRVAVFGDSHTFGLEVGYEDSWPRKLERELGEGFQVLNFGVDGYGVDQAYLRHALEARPWNADVAILSVAAHDWLRSVCVYAFLLFRGSEMPFAKPRAVIEDARLRILNVPVPPPERLFAAAAISELPLLDHDAAYDPAEWQRRFFHASHLLRLATSRFRRWPAANPRTSETASAELNSRLVAEFLRDAAGYGAAPIAAYLPDKTHLEDVSPSTLTAPQRDLRARGVPFVDMTACVAAVPPRQRFVIRHYAPAATSALARCFRDVIRAERPELWRTPVSGSGT